MSKLKRGLWVVALLAALAATPVWAEESSDAASWLNDLVAQIVAVVVGENAPAATPNSAVSGDEMELGEYVPVGG
jgi:hypothetical protein